ncbi:UDP-N-acetylmuramate dehydrogenase [Bizionia sediminis]|uniref:UDP-N-acetylenolpyruvoylglucosamine reductase n=1 Tax=Bizionia sediminis TaxID=1737064 RepID=A0ABW5KTF8_9FLAO
MQILENISLKSYNTFGIDVTASHFVSVTTVADLQKVLGLKAYPKKLILGGGSNLLLTNDVDALVIHINMKGIAVVSETDTTIQVKASAGENWHEFVLWCLQKDYGGLENLSLIPGNVGTAPIQNIGAYGVELKDLFVSCTALEIQTGRLQTFLKSDCNFGYRHSIFKQEVAGQYIICSVTFQLTKTNHVLHTKYGAILEELNNMKIQKPNIQAISNAVIAIRQRKLPDPKQIGNSGSFFKNPIVSVATYNSIKQQFPNVPAYTVSNSEVKIPAGWLIEKAGFKGKRFGNYGVHKHQALVLVNYSNASGNDIFKLATLIQHTIKRLFNVSLEFEVNIL